MKQNVGAGSDRALSRFRSDEAKARFLAVYDDAITQWAVAPEPRDVDTRFGSTHLLVCGPSTGVPIVLLPGIAVSAASWARNVGALAQRRSVIALDTITDAGRSVQREPVVDGAQLAQWFEDVLDAIGTPRVHAVGLSYGAWVACNVALHAPQRLASMTLVEPPSVLVTPRLGPMLALAPDAVLAKFAKSDAAIQRMLRRLNNGTMPGQPLLDLSVAGLRTFVGHAPPPKQLTDEQLRSIAAPALVLLGERSPVTNGERARPRAELVPHATVEVVPRAGHAIPAENADWFNERLLAFLDEVEAGAATDA